MSSIYPSSTQAPFLVLPFFLPVYVLRTAAAARGIIKGLIGHLHGIFNWDRNPVVFAWLCIEVRGQLGAKSSWSSISNYEEYEIRVNPKNTIRTCRRPPKPISTPASPPPASPIFSSTIWGWILCPGDWVLFIKRGSIYALDVGRGVKWVMVRPLVLVSSVWLMVYTYLGISIVPPPTLDLPPQPQKEHSQRSRPDHRRSHQHRISLLPPILLCTIQLKSDSAIVSGPEILVDEILHSHNALNISERYPSDRRRAQLPPYTAHFWLTSITNTNAHPRLPTSRHLLTSNDKACTLLGVFLTYKESSSSSDTLDTLSRKLSYRTKWRRCFGLS